MNRKDHAGRGSRREERHAAIEDSLEHSDVIIRQAGKELLGMYIRTLDGSDNATEIDQALSFISGKLRGFSLDEREMVLGEILIHIDAALEFAFPVGTRTYASQQKTVYLRIFKFLKEQLEQGGISSAGAVFRAGLHCAKSSIEKGHVLDWLFAREEDDEYRRFSFTESAIEEMGDEALNDLLKQKEYALIIANHYNFDLSYEQSAECITALVASGKEKVLQDQVRFIRCDSLSPLAHAIKDIWLSQMTPFEYKAFLLEYIDQQAVINPLFIDNTLLLQCNFELRDFNARLNNTLQRPEMSNEALLHIGTQVFGLHDLQGLPFYTPERMRAFSDGYAKCSLNFEEKFPQDPVGAKSAAMQFPWLMRSTDQWVMDLKKMTPERQREMEEHMQTLPEDQRARFAEDFAQEGVIGLSKEREASLAKILQGVPPNHQASAKKSFREKGITSGQMERWLGYHAFKVPEGWDPKVVGKIMLSRLQHGVSSNMHDASYFLSHFTAPEELHRNDEETRKQKKSYDGAAQKWLNNYVSTPAQTLIVAWQNRNAALADGCADNPGALVQWAKITGVKRLLEQLGESLDLTAATDQAKLAFLTETVRCASPEETLRIWKIIQASHTTESFFRPVKIDLGQGYSGEIFRKDDPRGTTLGADSGCCMSVGGKAESCIVAGYTDPRYSFFALYHEGRLVAQSLVYVNPKESSNTVVCDNIEACDGRDTGKIIDLYQKFFSVYAPANPVKISRVHLGMQYSSVGDRLPCVPPSHTVQTALPIYTDAASAQRLLFDAKTVSATENDIGIQWQDEKPMIQFTHSPIDVDWEADDDDNDDEDGDDEDDW